MENNIRKLRYFPNGFERYKSVAEYVERECLKLKPESVGRNFETYLWNGMKVEILHNSVYGAKHIIIRDQGGQIKLGFHDSEVDNAHCDFNIEGKPYFMGDYYTDNSESTLNTCYQYKAINDDTELPDSITTIIDREIEYRDFPKSAGSYIDYDGSYRDRLKKAYTFFDILEELTKYEEKQEENPEPEKKPKKDKLREFCKKEGIGLDVISAYLAESLAQQARTGDVMSAEAILERDLGNPEIEKRGPSIG